MSTRRCKRRLADAYAFPRFRPLATVRGIFGDSKARIVTLVRRSKKHVAVLVARVAMAGTTARCGVCGICRAARRAGTLGSRFARALVRAAAARKTHAPPSLPPT